MTMQLPHLILTMQLMYVQSKVKLKEQLHLTKTVQLILRITLTLQQQLQLFQITVQQHKQQLTQEVQKEQHVQDIPIFQLGVLQLYIILLEN